VAASAPATGPGSLWWDDTSGQLYLNYDDGNSIQWVVANNNAIEGGPFLPLTGGTVSGPLTVQRLNISSIPPAQPDGSPPAGSVHGDIYNNGGFLCIAP
jgi:hypothetical protein